jgi:outer membrane protein
MKVKKQSFVKKSIALMLLSSTLMWSASTVGAAPVEISLDDSIALALKNNSSISIYDAARQVTLSQLDEVKNGYQPTLNYTFSGSRINAAAASHTYYTTQMQPLHFLSPAYSYNEFNNEISLTLPLYTGGKLEGQVNQAKLNVTVADWTIESNRQQLKLAATNGYFSVLEAQMQVAVDLDSVNDLQAHLNNVQAQYNVGTVAKLDVLTSKVNLANAQQTLIKQKNTYDVAVASLNNVMGLPQDTELKIKDNLTYKPYDTALNDCIQYALQHRPEIIQADLNVKVQQEAVGIADSSNKPTVNLSAMTDWNDTKFAGTRNNNSSIGISASWNFFDFGLTKSKVTEANASVAKAVAQAKQERETVMLDVRTAYLNLREAEKRLATTKVTVEQGQENYKIAQVRYTSGVGTNVDVMDAETALNTARTNDIQALYDYNTSKATLDKAMGIAVK